MAYLGTLSSLLATGMLLGAFGCAPEIDETFLDSQSQAIVNGEMSEADTAVVALVYQGKQYCTGTMVGKRSVLTAAHCLPPHVDIPLESIQVFFGADLSQGGAIRNVTDGIANPSWSRNSIAGDVAMLAIGQDAPVAPMPLAYLDVAASGLLGGDARAVGYGITEVEGAGNGMRRTGTLTVDRYDDSSIYLKPGPSATCNGDSGGALIFMQEGEEVLGGIHSRSDCGQAIIAERVDVHAMDFIMPFIEAHEGNASCAADGMCATGCDEVDPDCPCMADGLCTNECVHPSADLDCTAECPADGVCDESCDYDYDCNAKVEDEELCAQGGDTSDCPGTSGCSSSGQGASWLFLLAFLGYFIRRQEVPRTR